MLQLNSSSNLSFPKKDQVLAEWNDTQTDFEHQSLHELFEAQVESNPNSVALICEEQQLTYAQLNSRANQLAHYLRNRGVETESLVGLYLERSIEMVVGILGILKAGGAYVPLAVDNPPERKAFILQDAQVSILLTQEHLLPEIPEQITQAICLDRDWSVISQQSADNFDIDVTLTNLAHIVYTSGSTGKPKGVMLTHANLSHYAHALQIAFNITPEDVYLHRGSIALIVSARQLLMPLATGASVVIATAEQKRDPLALFELVERKGVTIVDHVPSFWRNFFQMLAKLEPETKKTLLENKVRLIAAGGEQVTLDIAQSWQQEFNRNVIAVLSQVQYSKGRELYG
jgi:non-ribosomal peptide synthetase component F